ncbi:MAG TPA: hypothetical protein VFF98_06595 [Novosphingobium sp.]|nr:hypothetical protein [Novosphingobium sp.]HZV10660.1 hypothetical protein [Novosphingobium sp.]
MNDLSLPSAAPMPRLASAVFPERNMVFNTLTDCLNRLDMLGEQLAAAHLAACLDSLRETFIMDGNISDMDIHRRRRNLDIAKSD